MIDRQKLLTPEETTEARRAYNEGKTLIVLPLSSGRTAVFTRQFDLLSVSEFFPDHEEFDTILESLEARQQSKELDDRAFAAALRATRLKEDRQPPRPRTIIPDAEILDLEIDL